MTESPLIKKSSPSSGWILVTVLIGLCTLGTWLTAHHYKQRVFSSARGMVLENQWPESRISVTFTGSHTQAIHPGQVAGITVGHDTRLLRGVVDSVTPSQENATAIIRLTQEPGEVGRDAEGASGKRHHYLPVGTECSVTIDTTIPPEAIKSDPAPPQ